MLVQEVTSCIELEFVKADGKVKVTTEYRLVNENMDYVDGRY